MWLLDHNLPVQLKLAILNLKIDCDTTRARDWDRVQNGELVATSFAAGFRCILTRDVRFANEAEKALKSHPTMAVILIRLQQRRSSEYVQAFLNAWKVTPITPKPGQMQIWP
jgi:hypothetical protein